MRGKLIRVGTTYLPVTNVKESTEWYVNKLGQNETIKTKIIHSKFSESKHILG